MQSRTEPNVTLWDLHIPILATCGSNEAQLPVGCLISHLPVLLHPQALC